MADAKTGRPPSLDDVPGWFEPLDQALFAWFLERQQLEPPGDLVELGAYLGKSAILIGRHLGDGEQFIVCDLFGQPAADSRNQRESNYSYQSLDRARFEENYLAFHSQLPVVVQGPTATILDHVPSATVRFVHVDASHQYEHVARDVDAAREMLRAGGLAVFDDFRAAHTPGTAAAVWEAVFTKDLRPICVTANKFYGTWGDPLPAQQALAEWLVDHPRFGIDRQAIAGRPVLRVVKRRGTPAPASRVRRLAVDLTPPLVIRKLRPSILRWRHG
jgi:predicted O-methyltransferase YrrM